MTISKIETDFKTLSNLSIEELNQQLHIHEKLYSEFTEFMDRKKEYNEIVCEDIDLSYSVLEQEYWDIRIEVDRRENLKKQSWLDRLIAELQTRYQALNFYPHLYAGEWHVSIQDGNIQYRLYPYHNRADCIAECRILNRRYNAQ